jgi:transcriptional regulator with XRE-family HTH domain
MEHVDHYTDYRQCQSMGERLRFWRRIRNNMTRTALAKKVGMPYSSLAEIENDRQKDSSYNTVLAAALELNPHYLSTGEGDPLDTKAPAPVQDRTVAYAELLPVEMLDTLDPTECELARFKFREAVQSIIKLRHKQRKKKSA